jgi:CubicO group peptidase (beta-lactamase class C family)
VRDAHAAPLREDTVMYGASLTKAAFGYLVMQLVEEGRLGLDVPHRPLPAAALAELRVQRHRAPLLGIRRSGWRRALAQAHRPHPADPQRRLS